jgi:hypothetical protein
VLQKTISPRLCVLCCDPLICDRSFEHKPWPRTKVYSTKYCLIDDSQFGNGNYWANETTTESRLFRFLNLHITHVHRRETYETTNPHQQLIGITWWLSFVSCKIVATVRADSCRIVPSVVTTSTPRDMHSSFQSMSSAQRSHDVNTSSTV